MLTPRTMLMNVHLLIASLYAHALVHMHVCLSLLGASPLVAFPCKSRAHVWNGVGNQMFWPGFLAGSGTSVDSE